MQFVRRRPPSVGRIRHPETGIKELSVIMQQRGQKRLVNSEIRQRHARNERVKAGRVMPMIEDIDEDFGPMDLDDL